MQASIPETRGTQDRVRDLPSRVVVYLLLAGCLFTDLGYTQVWHRLTAGLHGLNTATPTAATTRLGMNAELAGPRKARAVPTSRVNSPRLARIHHLLAHVAH